jgi:hypothetical protein
MKVVHEQDDGRGELGELLAAQVANSIELARFHGFEFISDRGMTALADAEDDGEVDPLVEIVDSMISDKKRPSRQRGMSRYDALKAEAYIDALLDIRNRLTKEE